MTSFGRNMKVDVDNAQRDAVRRFWEEGLGCKRRSPREQFDLFDFEDGGCLGVFYVEGGALEPALWAKTVWLEFIVDDPAVTAERLVSLGGTTVKGMTEHPYVMAPGGPIFRLAPRG